MYIYIYIYKGYRSYFAGESLWTKRRLSKRTCVFICLRITVSKHDYMMPFVLYVCNDVMRCDAM